MAGDLTCQYQLPGISVSMRPKANHCIFVYFYKKGISTRNQKRMVINQRGTSRRLAPVGDRMRNLLILATLTILFSGCHSSQDTDFFDSSIAQKLDDLVVYLNRNDFEGTFILKDGKIEHKYFNIKIELNSYHIENLSACKIRGVTRTDEFVFFVKKGWKGNNFGYLFTTGNIQEINGFDDYKELYKNKEQKGIWYFASTHLY